MFKSSTKAISSSFIALFNEPGVSLKNLLRCCYLVEIISARKMLSDTFVSRILSVFTINLSLTKTISDHRYYFCHVEMVETGIPPS